MNFYEPITSVLFITTASWSTPFPIARSWSFPSFSASTSSITPSGRFVFLSPVVVRIWAAPTHCYKEKSRQFCYKLQDVNAAAMLDFTNDRTDSWVFWVCYQTPTTTRRNNQTALTTYVVSAVCNAEHLQYSTSTTPCTYHRVPLSHSALTYYHGAHLLHSAPTTEYTLYTVALPQRAPIKQCTYHRAHLPHSAPTTEYICYTVALPQREPTKQCTYHRVHLLYSGPTTEGAYQAVHLPQSTPATQSPYHGARLSHHGARLSHSAPTTEYTCYTVALPHRVPTKQCTYHRAHLPHSASKVLMLWF